MRLSFAFLVLLLHWAATAAYAVMAWLFVCDRSFGPAAVEASAGRKVELHICNAVAAAAEFENAEQHHEKVVPAGQADVVSIGPLRAGRYEFFDDRNPRTSSHGERHAASFSRACRRPASPTSSCACRPWSIKSLEFANRGPIDHDLNIEAEGELASVAASTSSPWMSPVLAGAANLAPPS